MSHVESGENEGIVPTQREPALATRPFKRVGKPEEAPVRVVICASAFHKIEQYLATNMTMELGGVLVGEVCVWKGHTYVEIHSSLPADTPRHGPAHFTFTAETWIELTQALEDQFPDRYMVGWYHSHPRLGVFFSGQDNDVHRVVFNQPWHVALVIDPSTGQAGFYGWTDDRPDRLPGYYVLDDSSEFKGKPPFEEPPKRAQEDSRGPSATESEARRPKLAQGVYYLLGSLFLVVAASAWMLAQIEELRKDVDVLQRRLAELTVELTALRRQVGADDAAVLAEQSVLLASDFAMSIDGAVVVDGTHIPQGSTVALGWTVTNQSEDPVVIGAMGLTVTVEGIARPDLFVPPDGSIVLPARLEPGNSISVKGQATLNELGSCTVSVVVLTPGATGWQILSTEAGLPAVLYFQVVTP